VHNDLKEIACKQMLSNKNEIFSIEFENQKYWVKKARATTPNTIQKFFYKFLPFELLIPSLAKSAKEALEYETEKLKLFRSKGINTPEVVYVCDDFFILEDAGVAVHALIREKKISQKQMYYYIDKVIELLAEIHNKNQFHGGAQTRNFTYKEGDVFAIDLEESFSSSVDIETLKFRDFLLLLLSFVKIKASFELDYKYIIQQYVTLTKSQKIRNDLKKLANKISFLIYLSEIKWINNVLGSDVKGFFALFRTLKKL
jgi:tRNA A-37 threonylcarbamoyl transferase component Bud32